MYFCSNISTPLLVRSARSGWIFYAYMSKIPYTKPPLSYSDQIKQLQSRGLIILDEQAASDVLEHVSYYRLSGYWNLFLDLSQKDRFIGGTSFDDIYTVYAFDQQLRQLIQAALGELEIAIRAKLIYFLSHTHGPFWLENSHLFIDPLKFANTLHKLGQEYGRSDAEFIQSFRKKYAHHLPPSWIALEVTTFGSLSVLYSNLKNGRTKRDIANHFGVSDPVFASWLHTLTYIRNVCAHHARFWNRQIRITPQKPLSISNTWLTNLKVSNKTPYYSLAIIAYLLQTANKKNTFSKNLRALLADFPTVSVFSMGFPSNWSDEELFA